MIVAGAGTGKTTVLTARVLYLIESGLARPEEILALTFTEKAAREMSDRLDAALLQGRSEVEVSTFHALCDRLLRRHALEMGLDAGFSVVSSAQAKLLLRESLFLLPLDRYRPRQDPLSYLSALSRHFDKAKNEGVRVSDYRDWVEALGRSLESTSGPQAWDRYHRQKELAESYRVYQELLAARGYLDFGDLLLTTLELLDSSPYLLASLRRRYRYVLVDEFQDTNRIQFELVRRLAGNGERLTVVGDDDQAIYRFRGASLSNVLSFADAFPGTHQALLRQNYRSLQPILDAAYRSIVNNNPRRLEVQHGLDKRLRSARPDLLPLGDEAVEIRTFTAVSDEADAVAERIEELMGKAEVELSDIAILVRNNKDANVYLRAMEGKGIPYRFQGSQGLYERAEVRQLLAFAKLLTDPNDSLSCHHLAASPLFSLSSLTLLQLNAFARQRNLTLYQALREHRERRPDGGVTLTPREIEKLDRFLSRFEELAEQVYELSPRALLHAFMTQTGWMARLALQADPEDVVEARNLARFFDVVRSHESLFPEDRLPQFVEHLELLRESGDSPPTVESDHHGAAVSILTVHGSKGLEFPAVFMVGLTARRFPSWHREDPLEFPPELMTESSQESEEAHTDEERRLFYVGMTRAQRLLWLSMAYDEGNRRSQQVSPFLREAFVEQSLDLRPQSRSPIEELARHAASPRRMETQGWPSLPMDRPLRLTWSKLETYWNCHRQYFFQYVMALSAPPSHQRSYGEAMHQAVASVLQRKQQGVLVSLEEVKAGFRTRWKRMGFLSAEHSEHELLRGLETIEDFWHREQSEPVPRFVEREFRADLGDNTWLLGTWDRVDEVNGCWRIVDYKTSVVADQQAADRRASESRQLVLYALALETTMGQRPSEVRLDFLGSGCVGVAAPQERDFSRLRGDVRRAALGIRERDYEPNPSYRACMSCAFRAYCEASAVTT